MAIPTDRFAAWTGELRHFGWSERPSWYAHDAARFAGRPRIPDPALILGIGQAGTYPSHNGPGRKVVMDARLEIPARATFEAYTRVEQWLRDGEPRWPEAVRLMGAPLILAGVGDNADAVASILADPRLRCVWYDPVAAGFVPSSDRRLEAAFPTVVSQVDSSISSKDRAQTRSPPRSRPSNASYRSRPPGENRIYSMNK